MTDHRFLLCLECKWEPSDIQNRPGTILSKMIKFQGEKLFRVGLKNGASSSTLLFITLDVSQIGMDNVAVTFSSQDNIWKTMEQHEEVDGWGIQLHTSQIDFVAAGNYSFTFQVYMASREPDCCSIQRLDGLLGQQLWSAAINQVGTDYELTAEGKKFFVHRFMLAARSPVFEAQFQKKEEEEIFHQIESASCLHQLLKFMYTGELEGATSRELKELAEKYEIRELERLCKAAFNTIEEGSFAANLGRLALLLKTDADILEIKPNVDLKIEPKPDTCVVEITWTLPGKELMVTASNTTAERSKMSEGFSLDEYYYYQKDCSVKFTLNSQRREGIIYFFVHQNPENQHYSVEEVSCIWSGTVGHPFEIVHPNPEKQNCSVVEVKDYQSQLIKMTPTISGGLNSTRKFSSTTTSVYDFPDKITFYVKLLCLVPSFSYKFVDKWFGCDLWKVAEEKTLTDVELLVGNSTFSAHRALLSARSPVFSAMFKSEMEESRTGRVLITDVDPETFTRFLRFLYQGEMGSWGRSMKEKLFALADRYEVGALMDICRSTSSVDVEEMMDAFFSF